MLVVGPPWPKGPLSWWEEAGLEAWAAGTLWGWRPHTALTRRKAQAGHSSGSGVSLPQFPHCLQLSLPWRLYYHLRGLWPVGVLAARPTLGEGPGTVVFAWG